MDEKEGNAQLEAIVGDCKDLLDPPSERGWRENVEVFFVALVIALAIRAYFLQPFKIPTHSMRPTLYGVVVEDREGEKPNPFVQIWDLLCFGKVYHRVEAQKGGVLQGVRESNLLGFLPVKLTELKIGDKTHRVWTSLEKLAKAGYDLEPGQEIPAGTELINYSTQTGDHIFVNKVAYHFKLPKKGDVMVFTTQNIPRIASMLRAQGIPGSQYYIKRCVAVGDDTVRVVPPYLYINDKIQHGKPFDRVYSMKDGYNGYTLIRGYLETTYDTYQVPENGFWAMGDNSAHSLDSRYWGPVPRRNLVGAAMLVYWPFGRRWGLVD